MSRYLSFVFLALSASSVLAAPQGFPAGAVTDTVTDTFSGLIDTAAGTAGEVAGAVTDSFSGFAPGALSGRAPAELPNVPPVPDTTTLTRPALGERSNNKVYSSTSLRKRDWQYPTSTKDCLKSSEDSGKSMGPSYTHDGQEYYEDCLTRVALSVPFEQRKSCRSGERGYDEECLYKKAFDEDWKVDMEKAKEEELAWRALNPSASSSDTWRKMYPSAVGDCSVDPKSMGRLEKAMSDMEGWSAYSTIPSGKVFEDDCMSRFAIDGEIPIDVNICSAAERTSRLTDILNLGNLLGGRSTREVAATSHDLAARQDLLAVVFGVLEALRSGCLVSIIIKIMIEIGLHVKIIAAPLITVEVDVDIDLIGVLKL